MKYEDYDLNNDPLLDDSGYYLVQGLREQAEEQAKTEKTKQNKISLVEIKNAIRKFMQRGRGEE